MTATPIAAPAPAGLVWDTVVKEYNAQAGETKKIFTFELTNPSDHNIIVEKLTPACSCTVAKLPALPWTMAPGATGRIEVSIDWTGRYGPYAQNVFIETSAGPQTLTLKIQIPPPPGLISLPLQRARNLKTALADRQAVFKTDCARCHAAPASGKLGRELYTAACGICHEATPRATMVPDLRTLPSPTGRAFWRQAVAHGKPGSLMPAFALSEGGPLTEREIDSLVDYLQSIIPSRPGPLPSSTTTK